MNKGQNSLVSDTLHNRFHADRLARRRACIPVLAWPKRGGGRKGLLEITESEENLFRTC